MAASYIARSLREVRLPVPCEGGTGRDKETRVAKRIAGQPRDGPTRRDRPTVRSSAGAARYTLHSQGSRHVVRSGPALSARDAAGRGPDSCVGRAACEKIIDGLHTRGAARATNPDLSSPARRSREQGTQAISVDRHFGVGRGAGRRRLVAALFAQHRHAGRFTAFHHMLDKPAAVRIASISGICTSTTGAWRATAGK